MRSATGSNLLTAFAALASLAAPLGAGELEGVEELARARLWIASDVEDSTVVLVPNARFADPLVLPLEPAAFGYARGASVSVQLGAQGSSGRSFVGWEVDGKLVEEKDLVLTLDALELLLVARFAP